MLAASDSIRSKSWAWSSQAERMPGAHGDRRQLENAAALGSDADRGAYPLRRNGSEERLAWRAKRRIHHLDAASRPAIQRFDDDGPRRRFTDVSDLGHLAA